MKLIIYTLKHNPLLGQYSFRVMGTGGGDDSHCNRIHFSLTTVHCFNNAYVAKQPVAWKEYCAEYWLKELLESMDRCTGCSDITEILMKKVLNTIQSIVKAQSHILRILKETA